MFRAIVFSIAIAAGSAAGAEVRPVAVPSGDHVTTCNYFSARTFGLQGERGAWLSLLAESCAEALRRMGKSMADGRLPDPADADYLKRLTTLRHVVTDLNVARFTAHRARPGASTRSSVSDSGEYLIARSLGVMSSFTTWAEAAKFRTVALPAE